MNIKRIDTEFVAATTASKDPRKKLFIYSTLISLGTPYVLQVCKKLFN